LLDLHRDRGADQGKRHANASLSQLDDSLSQLDDGTRLALDRSALSRIESIIVNKLTTPINPFR